MSATLIAKVLKMHGSAIASYSGASFFYSLLVVVLFAQFMVQHKVFFVQYLNIIPKGLLRAFNAGGDITSFGGFVGAEYLSFIWVVIVVAFVIAFTSGALAKELEQGTLELVLAYPIGRLRFFFSKVAALVIGILVMVGATLLGLWAGALTQHFSVSIGSYLAIGVLAVAFALAIAGYGFVFSALASERAQAAGWATALTLVFYGINFAAQNWDQLKALRPLTIFNYYSPEDAINLGRLDVGAFLVLIGLTLVSTAAAAVIFRVRDLSS
jgi:ABC-2 type transport system permease protein